MIGKPRAQPLDGAQALGEEQRRAGLEPVHAGLDRDRRRLERLVERREIERNLNDREVRRSRFMPPLSGRCARRGSRPAPGRSDTEP